MQENHVRHKNPLYPIVFWDDKNIALRQFIAYNSSKKSENHYGIPLPDFDYRSRAYKDSSILEAALKYRPKK